jgi:hypothetical protein
MNIKKIYLIVGSHGLERNKLIYYYGSFITDLAFGHIDNYPQIVTAAYLKDAIIYNVRKIR